MRGVAGEAGEGETERAVGAVVGAAVGDALGAPFEFGPAGAFSAKYPQGAAELSPSEMRGGGGWDPGEATDDTQMAVLVADSLLERGEPKDIGLQTEAP